MSRSRQELQGVLGTALDGLLHALEPLGREGLGDDEQLVVIELEDVRRETAAHGIRLAQIPVDLEFHQSSVSVPRRDVYRSKRLDVLRVPRPRRLVHSRLW